MNIELKEKTALMWIVAVIFSTCLIYVLIPNQMFVILLLFSFLLIFCVKSIQASIKGEVFKPYKSFNYKTKIWIYIFYFIFSFLLFLSLIGSRFDASKSLLGNLIISVLAVISLMCLVLYTTYNLLSYDSNATGTSLIGKYRILIYSLPSIVIYSFYLISYFPGAMSPDSLDQWSQTISHEFNDWHPVAHTWFIMLTTIIWKSPAAYSVVQILILAFIIGYLGYTFEKYGVRKFLIWMIVLCMSLIPINGIYSITMWKDILYSACMLLFSIFIFNLIKTRGNWLDSNLNIFLYFISSLGFIMFRHNGLLVFVVTLVILAIIFKSDLKKVYFISIIVVVVQLIITGPLYNFFNVKSSDPNEALAIPTQLIASVIAQDGNLAQEQKDFFNEVLPLDMWRKLYNPYSVDPIKFNEQFNRSFLLENKNEFLKQWLVVSFNNPKLVIKAYLKQVSVVWQIKQFNDGVSTLYLTDIYPKEIGEKMGLTSIVINEKLTSVINQILNSTWLYPLNIIWRPAIYTFLIILFSFVNILRGNWKYSLISLPVMLNTGMLLAAIPAQDFRYSYGNVLVMFLAFLTVFVGKNSNLRGGTN
ncbi:MULTISPECIES: DUF6020 family protein [Paenibacillus]|uniref:Glycosyltransferase RgtA/B/C/D-like domain-containing protein n=1 Tax=Paenibacillus ihbetae TaxID=1870820 RepID=A0A1B2E2L0_9BACL|nr:DUF6020 family protein [Paenibacillus ihbetae]ANY74137.1 hypothetical protein BBD41_16965 [Paenibacillus ihbetae]